MAFKVPEKYRVKTGKNGSDLSFGNNGMFGIPTGKFRLQVIASDGAGWEHVSVLTPSRCPTWEEMCLVKKLFWDDGDCVVQYHPPKSDHVNIHPFCLHLWRPIDQVFPMPELWMV